MEGVIARRPWILLAVWIVIVILLSPLAANISSVVKTSQEQFLPSTAESVKADETLSRLAKGNATETAPGFLLVIHGVPVNYDSYKKLKNWYYSLNNENVSLSSWIDIVNGIEGRLELGYSKGINASIGLVNGLIGVAVAYNGTLIGVNGTARLLNASDRIYDSYIALNKAKPVIDNTLSAMNFSCNNALPIIAETYFDVVRAEALLEDLTDAYTSPPLGEDDIGIVVSASNVTGLHPLNPELIALVYNYTITHGGPQLFNNRIAAIIAGSIAWNILSEHGVPQDVEPFYNLTLQAWINSVVNDTDHRQVIAQAPDIAQGQLQLMNRVLEIESNTKPIAGGLVLNALESELPEKAKPIALSVGKAVLSMQCNVTSNAAVLGLTNMLVERGAPRDIALKVAELVVNSQLDSPTAALLGIETIIEKANLTLENETIHALAQLLVEYDPEGTGLNGKIYGLAAIITVEKAVGHIDNTTISKLISVDNLEEATIEATKIILTAKTGSPQSTMLLGLLQNARLLGASKSIILMKAPDLLAPLFAEKSGNITEKQARILVKSAISIVTGKSTISEEVGKLTNESLPGIIANLTERLKGTLIEKNGDGFIIALKPRINSSDERVRLVEEIRSDVERGLSSLGYNAKVLLGGNDYMHYEISKYAEKDIQKSDKYSMVFVIIILALIMESIAAVFLPFIGIGFGLITSLAIAFALAKSGIIDVTTHSRTIMFTTGLGLGIDYAAYVSRRFREAASRGLPSREAAVEAYKMSLRPVIAGASAAMIGFGSMLLAWDFPFVSSIGANVPLTIFFVMVTSLTFIPALLAYVGETRWFWWPRHPLETRREKPRLLGFGNWSTRNPWVLLGIAVVLAVIAGGVMASFQGSYNIALNLPAGSESRKTLEFINANYDPGVLYPVTIIASTPDKANEIASKIVSLSCISSAKVEKGYEGRVVTAVMSVDPLSKKGVDCAAQIREKVHSIDSGSLVGGMSSVNLDLHNLINDRFYHRVYPVAIILMFLVFLGIYGGLVTAISAIIAVVLAAYAGSALTVILYEKVLGSEVLWFLPVIVFTAILGVGMDYNSFYIARAREECLKECGKDSVARSIALATPTVLGLATIMAGAYVGLALASSPGLSMMGTALVFGVILAGLNAGVLLTPPLIALLGRASWWPGKTGKKPQ